MHADQILVLEKGQIVQRGNHEELIAQTGMYRNLWHMQMDLEEGFQSEGEPRGVIDHGE